jgi:hypothetical protein
VSVKIHDVKNKRDDPQLAVYNVWLAAAIWLIRKRSRYSSISIDANPSYFEYHGGFTLTLLTILALSKKYHSIDIALETYNGKTRKSFSQTEFKGTTNEEITEIASNATDELYSETESVGICHLFEKWHNFLRESCQNRKIWWGIGATVSTGIKGLNGSNEPGFTVIENSLQFCAPNRSDFLNESTCVTKDHDPESTFLSENRMPGTVFIFL